MNTQPETLRLADVIEGSPTDEGIAKAAAELRRLHEVNAELTEALQHIVGDCVSPDYDGGASLAAIQKGCAAIAKATGSEQ